MRVHVRVRACVCACVAIVWNYMSGVIASISKMHLLIAQPSALWPNSPIAI